MAHKVREKFLYGAAFKYCTDNGFDPKDFEFMITIHDQKGTRILEWNAGSVPEPKIDFLLDYTDEETARQCLRQLRKDVKVKEVEEDKMINIIKNMLVEFHNIENPNQWIKNNLDRVRGK